MAKAKYQTPEYRAVRKAIDQAQAEGQWLTCQEVECKHPSRDIAPWQKVDVAHDTTGTVILGPAHRSCNRAEGAARGNRARPESDALRFKTNPCADCGARCYGVRCRPCRSKHTEGERTKRAWLLRSADALLFESVCVCGQAVAGRAAWCSRRCYTWAYYRKRAGIALDAPRNTRARSSFSV